MQTPFEPLPATLVDIRNHKEKFPVHRIYCVGRNYAEHTREMGGDPEREAPFFFSKPADAIASNNSDIPYPPRTRNLHHEVELVVAIGTGGANISVEDADGHIYGYAVGNDLTRRDLQKAAREKGRPWDTAKGFDLSAPITAIHAVADVGHIRSGEITLSVNGEIRQRGDIADLIWNIPEVIAELSTLFTLCPGDLVFTGTPAGVGALNPGDSVVGTIAGLQDLTHRIGEIT